MLFALIATDEDVARFGPELRQVLSSLPGAVATAEVPENVIRTAVPAAPVASAPTTPTNGSDNAAAAREARAFYANVAKAIGQANLTSDQKNYAKAQRKAGQSVAQVASAIGTPVAPAAPAPTDPIAQMEAQLAQMRADVAAASAAPVQPAPAANPKVTGIPPVGSLPAPVCTALQQWAAGLTSDRQVAVTRYAQGMQDGPALIAKAYGDKLAKFTSKVNALLKG